MKIAQISKTSSFIPEKVLTNYDLEKIVETSDEWITTRTGIKERRIVSDGVKASDIAFLASKDIIEDDIDLVIVSTSTPDMVFPSTASLLLEKLGINKKNIACFDISSACTGALYALECGRFFIEGGQYKKALIVTSETTSKVINWKDRSTCVLFGDGAGACLLKGDKERGIIASYFNTNPSLSSILTLSGTIQMKGQEVFKYAVLYMTEAIEVILAKTGFNIDDISLIIPHQANLRIINLLAKRLKIDEDKFFINLPKYGNMISASTFVALDEANKKGIIKNGDLILLVGIGGGLTWGSMLIRW